MAIDLHHDFYGGSTKVGGAQSESFSSWSWPSINRDLRGKSIDSSEKRFNYVGEICAEVPLVTLYTSYESRGL